MASKRLRVVALIVLGVLFGSAFPAVAENAVALDGSEFQAGYIISDEKFFDKNTMNEAQIQDFIVSKSSNCQSGYVCLKDFRMDTFTRAAVEPGHCAAYQGAASEPASRIIYKAAQACGINPQVLLVLLQKETSLITDSSPTSGEYRKAMGYGCPDTSDCDSAYYGFYNQVYSAAKQFRQYTNYPDRRYRVGNVSVQYHPNAACGATVVNIKNQATANLYNYTPYQPNSAALANLSGSGNSCSSYGNRNFWVFFNNWFGAPNLEGSPVSSLDIFQAVPGGIRVAGWTWDPNTSESIQLHVYVNGVGKAIVADRDRPDVGATWPHLGPAHGFDEVFPVTSSAPQQVCVYAINLGPGQNVQLRCQTLPGLSGSPVGVLDSVTAAGGKITASGWAYDPDTAASIPVHIYFGNSGVAFTADDDRADVGQVYPEYGPKHGYSRSANVGPGTYSVCVYGINVAGAGENRQLGCRTVTIASGAPYGVLDTVTVAPGTITASGWTFDPDSTNSTPVHVYVGASGVSATADSPRSDVGSAYPGYGDNHGYNVTVPATPGVHTVCSYGIDIVAPGANRQLGCRTVTAMSGPPVGVIDAITSANGVITAGGWAYDPDTAEPIQVTLVVDRNDGAAVSTLAGGSRPDFGAVYRAYGPNHGYSISIPATPGSHEVCVYAVNTGPGEDRQLGCRQVNN